jgi:hypothetical protein
MPAQGYILGYCVGNVLEPFPNRAVNVLACVGRGANGSDHPLDRGIPALVRCPPCSMKEPLHHETEVLLCHSEALIGWH